jgi:hypothetical protein
MNENAHSTLALYRLAIEAHLHLYPSYNLTQFFINLCKNLNNLVPYSAKSVPEPVVQIALLAEPDGLNFFKNLRNNPPRVNAFGMNIEPHSEKDVLMVKHSIYGVFFIIAGRQIVTKEKLELIAIGTNIMIPDDEPILETVQHIQKLNAIPALPWGFGKWMGRRGVILKKMLELVQKPICLIDSAMRPEWFNKSSLFKKASLLKIPVLAGSDPLPLTGQEFLAGTYVSNAVAQFDVSKPLESTLQLISSEDTTFINAGRRRSTAEIANALWNLKRIKSRNAR